MDFEKIKREEKISREVAEEQLLRWLDAYDVDACAMKEREPEGFKVIEKQYDQIVSRIQRGLLSVEDDGDGGVNVIQYLSKSVDGKDTIIYKHMTGRHLIARSNADGQESKKNALLAAMSERPTSFFEKMKWGVDAKTADMVYAFFILDY